MGLITNPRQIIKDGITSLRDVWSSSKVSSELSGKQATLVSGTNIKTINTQSLLGSGDIHISGGGDIPKINMTATTATLDPNKFYVWGEVASLDISLAAEIAGIENIYKFQFRSGATATTLTLPSSVKWNSDIVPNILFSTTYIVTIESNIATIDRLYSITLLPDEYQQVEYLESSGTQSINTNVYVNQESIIEIEVEFYNFTTSSQYLIPMGSFASTVAVSLYVNKTNNNTTTAYIEIGGIFGARATPVISLTQGVKTIITIELDHGVRRVTQDGNYLGYILYNQKDLLTGFPIFIFSSADNGVPYSFGNVKICSFKHRIGNVMLANLVPCYRIADNVAGMYDIMRDVFLTNVGTGSFIVGPDV